MLFTLFLSTAISAAAPCHQHYATAPNATEADLWTHSTTTPNWLFQADLGHSSLNDVNQEPSRKSELDKVLDRLKQFDKEEQSAMVESVTETMLVQPHLLFERVAQALQELQKKPAKKLAEFAPKYYNANEFAPALKLRTRKYKASQSRWKSFAKKYSNPLAPPLDPNFWQWSFGEQGLIPPKKAAPAESQVRGMWTGKWPQADLLQAQVLAYLDNDSSMQAVAHYFEHSYRDRDGRLYLGFTLEQVWASGLRFGVSDVETIAFLRLILDDHKVKSPIKASMHDGLYALIEDSFADYREYKQLRQALAARFLNSQGEVPPILQGTSKQFDVAWALCDFQLPQMRNLLHSNPSRKKFFAAVEKLKQSGDFSPEELQQRLDLLHSFPTAIAQAAYLGLKREGLLGLHKR